LHALGPWLTMCKKNMTSSFLSNRFDRMAHHGVAECKNLRKLKGLTNLEMLGTKRSTWVTRENFQNMYENVYERMVEAGIAKK
jgi:hypothetical protein